MKIIVYIVLIAVIVGLVFCGVKAIKQSDVFQSVTNAIDTVKDAFDGTSSNCEQGQQSGGGNEADTSGKEVTEIADSALCCLFTLQKKGANVARAISVGDVFEDGDVIVCNRSLYTDEQILSRLESVQYFVSFRTTEVYSYVGAYMFGNNVVDVVKISSVSDPTSAIYRIYVGDVIVWTWDGMSLGWVYDSVILAFGNSEVEYTTDDGYPYPVVDDVPVAVEAGHSSGGGGGYGHCGGR